MMLCRADVLLVFCIVGAADALYKQWIPDTNYENKTNWDTGFVPCGNDKAYFPAGRRVSVFVETTHSVQEMRLPVDGEFILTSGAGFYIGGGQEPGCGAGATSQFRDSETLRWFDPGLWRAAVSLDDMNKGRTVFSVHEESVPCQYDDVVFRAGSSFRVDTTSNQPSVPVRSVSVLGLKFTSNNKFSSYVGSRSGQLQFHGSSTVNVGHAPCDDPSGCVCGNSPNLDRICGSITCPSLTCKKPLRPVGHCCDVCGAIVTVDYTDGFNLETYRGHLRQQFLQQPQYKSIQIGISKVLMQQRFMNIIPFGASAEIQIVLLDQETDAVVESLAREIVQDALSAGSDLGIAGIHFQGSSGSSSDDEPLNVVGIVLGVVFGTLAVVLVVILLRKGFVSMPKVSLPSLSSLPWPKSVENKEDIGGPVHLHSFENPMFDQPAMMPDKDDFITLTQSGVHFVNPGYDETQNDFHV